MRPGFADWENALEAICKNRCRVYIDTFFESDDMSLPEAMAYAAAVEEHARGRSGESYEIRVAADEVLVYPPHLRGLLRRPLP